MKLDNSKNNIANSVNDLAKLAWACRRGMLELDVLLGNFLKKAYSGLSGEDQHIFIGLLHYPDPELYALLLEQQTPEDRALARVIGMIRECTQNKDSGDAAAY